MDAPGTLGTPTRGDADVGQIAALIGDPHRARMLLVMADGRAHAASVLASAVGLKRSAATAHLRRLVDGGLVCVEQVGRFRLHSLASSDVARLVEALAALAPPQGVSSLSESNKAVALRTGRTCYDHLAGRLGVAVTDALRCHEALLFEDPPDGVAAGGSSVALTLGPFADEVLQTLDVDLGAVATKSPRRPELRLCVDWSERRFHLAGALGAALLDACLRNGWVTRHYGRSVRLTTTGRDRLEIALPRIVLDTLPAV